MATESVRRRLNTRSISKLKSKDPTATGNGERCMQLQLVTRAIIYSGLTNRPSPSGPPPNRRRRCRRRWPPRPELLKHYVRKPINYAFPQIFEQIICRCCLSCAQLCLNRSPFASIKSARSAPARMLPRIICDPMWVESGRRVCVSEHNFVIGVKLR